VTLVRDRALVLRRFPYSESSLVVRALTREHGRVHLIARGAYRPRSRYFAVLDLFDTLELEWSASAARDLHALVCGEIVVRRRALTASLRRYRAGLSMLELCDLGSRPEERDAPLHDLCERSLERLGEEGWEPELALVVFELGFLHNHGLAPALESCAACGGEAPPLAGCARRAAFSAGAGGRLCARCAEDGRASGRRVGTLPLDVLTTAAELSRSLPGGGDPRPRPLELVERVRDFVERFLDYHLETRPRSHQAFLAAPNRNAPDQTTS